ncbi:hypothetical protein Dip510_001872 [Elusimicrobium posterum]|uniref:hypothetical protein n=1 Tax=Elusimicrobium posterum TaxID=3116653 RepID=UPI003C7707CA
MEKIYIQLLDEGTDTYRPVSAIKIKDDIYELLGEDIYNPEDEHWEFLPGDRVKVKIKKFSDGGYGLLAVSKEEM